MSYFLANNISVSYGNHKIINDISFELENNSITGILGANGSGKTTLLKAICGLLPYEGSFILEGDNLKGLSPKKLSLLCSYIPQRSGISINISALDVVLMGFNPYLGILEHPTTKMKEEAINSLSLVGLSDHAQSDYLNLSEGQKQLCILARTLVGEKKLFLLDEPESALDFTHRYKMLEILKSRTKGCPPGAIITLHDPQLALNCCDKLLLLSEGKISGTILPHSDKIEKIEQQLSSIYGPVSIKTCKTRSGQEQYVMLKEDI